MRAIDREAYARQRFQRGAQRQIPNLHLRRLLPASVELPNGDSVGVVEPWRHPDEGGEITPEMAAMQARAEEVFLAVLVPGIRVE